VRVTVVVRLPVAVYRSSAVSPLAAFPFWFIALPAASVIAGPNVSA
jgi:hypothetical protein